MQQHPCDTQKTLNDLRNEISHNGSRSPDEIVCSFKADGFSIRPDQALEATAALNSVDGLGQQGFVPRYLIDVISELLEGKNAESLLDPWAYWGPVTSAGQQATRAKNVWALTPDPRQSTIGSIVYGDFHWLVGDPFETINQVPDGLDVIVSMLPLGYKGARPIVLELPENDRAVIDDYQIALLVAAARKLKNDGIAIFTVGPLFFYRNAALPYFSRLGLGIEAAFQLPFDDKMFDTGFLGSAIIVRKKVIPTMFVAQLSFDWQSTNQVLRNFREKNVDGPVEMGRLVDPNSYFSFNSLRLSERVESKTKNLKMPLIELGKIATVINLGKRTSDFEFPEHENELFIPLIGNSRVVVERDQLKLKKHNYAQVVIDAVHSDARFVAEFLNSELGRDLIHINRAATFIPKLSKKSLQVLNVFVPNLAMQRSVLRIDSLWASQNNIVLGLQNELAEARRQLWANPTDCENVGQQIAGLSSKLTGSLKQTVEESLDRWFETLPFPMASILRAWQAASANDFKTKYEHLMHFFEATAEFFSVILLSAFGSNQSVFAPHREKLVEALGKGKVSLRRATFGTWKVIIEYLGKQTRSLLNEPTTGRSLCAELFMDPTCSIAEMISSKEISALVSATNQKRNDWTGHGGVVSQVEAESRNAHLVSQLEMLRSLMLDAWNETQLLHATSSRLRRNVFENEVKILMGSNSEFLKESRQMSICLDVENLYLIKKNETRGLKLLPFVQVGPSPQSAINACYFFNRAEPDGQLRFVSYHFASQPDRKMDSFVELSNVLGPLFRADS